LGEVLPARYLTYVEERVVLTTDAEPEAYRPDVYVKHEDLDREAGVSGYGRATATPVYGAIDVPYEVKERFLEVRGPDDGLVAVVELLSPSNKRAGEGRNAYLAKRNRLLASGIHLIELDLLLNGERLPIRSPWPPGDYIVLVVRGNLLGTGEIYPIQRGEALPVIRFPLAASDPDAAVDLQAALGETWSRGRFAEKLERRQVQRQD
ncbi:MAG TPA: DUF4058 family protein, partial [Limnochordia bacterium]|nr:DUF4058 family protein [Limnochordia bacterium]